MSTLNLAADADALCSRASALIEAGRPGAARPLLAAAKALSAATPELVMATARLALSDADWGRAVMGLDAGIAEAPSHAGLRKLRAEVRHRMGDIEGAARDAAEAVILDRDDPRARRFSVPPCSILAARRTPSRALAKPSPAHRMRRSTATCWPRRWSAQATPTPPCGC
jgi:hypothetical protein